MLSSPSRFLSMHEACACVFAWMCAACTDGGDEWQTAHASNYTRSMYGNGHIIRHDMVQSPLWWLHRSHTFALFFAHTQQWSRTPESLVRLYGNSPNWPLMNCLSFWFRRATSLGCVTLNQFAHQIGSWKQIVHRFSPTPYCRTRKFSQRLPNSIDENFNISVFDPKITSFCDARWRRLVRLSNPKAICAKCVRSNRIGR